MSSCPTCGNRDYLCQQCKMDELEDRLGLPSDHFDDDAGIVCWVQDLNGDWHASMYFEGTRHVSACGEIFETPVTDVRDDPRRLSDVHTCDDCDAALEAEGDETAPDGGEFAPASELRADGGVDQASSDADHYDGAGDGQCLAIKKSDGERCTNGVYGNDEFCGHHKRASDVTTAIEASDVEWVRCDECGWQKAEWVPGEPPFCSCCGVEAGPDYEVRDGGEAA